VPEFLDLLLDEVKRNREELAKVAGGSSTTAEWYRELVQRKWNRFPERDLESRGVYAVDSSSGTVELAGGGVLVIARSIALGIGGLQKRRLRLEAFYPKDLRDYEDYLRLLREHLEHEVALDALETDPEFILVDGSLYGRMIHVLKEVEIQDREDFMFDYVEAYSDFLSAALRKGTVVVGVSKDSRSTLFKEEVLKEQVLRIAREHGLDTQEILKLWSGLRRRPREVVEEVRRKTSSGAYPAELYKFFEEARSPVPDSKILYHLNLGSGYTTPLLLKLSRVLAGQLDLVLDDGSVDHVERLSRVFQKTRDRIGSRFEGRARDLISRLRSYPPVAMFYVVFESGEDPVRVDVVARDISALSGANGLQGDAGRFMDDKPESLLRVIALLRGMYAGIRGYNVLLLEADRRVKISDYTLETYRGVLMRELGLFFLLSRGERRVHYP